MHFPIMFDFTGLGWFVDFFLSFTEKLIFQKKNQEKIKEFSDARARAFVSIFTLHVTVVYYIVRNIVIKPKRWCIFSLR